MFVQVINKKSPHPLGTKDFPHQVILSINLDQNALVLQTKVKIGSVN